ncbi:hypothetical protein ACHAXM_003640 [Skeletonema potamos]|jgi:hypothetical protein
MSEKPIERDAKGIPLKSPYPDGVSVVMLYSGMTFIITAIGTIIAYFTSYFTESKVTAANAKIAIISEYDLGWLYLGIFLIRILTLPININLGMARKESKAGLPDQHVYKGEFFFTNNLVVAFINHFFTHIRNFTHKHACTNNIILSNINNLNLTCIYIVMGAEGSKLGYVLMENEGVHGVFNRAQRALQNYHENFPGVVVQYVAASFVFPFEAFVCMMIWQIATCVGAVGYADSVDGRMKGRLPGYFAMSTIGGMIIIIAFKALSS